MNVALHEMAHCLEKENQMRIVFQQFFNHDDWIKWAESAALKLEDIRQNKNVLINSYGGKNMQEMFAVCVETFFEKPEEFKSHLPILYQRMCDLLQQDPTMKENPTF